MPEFLHACWKCGGQPAVIIQDRDKQTFKRVECLTCGLRGRSYLSTRMAVRDWNETIPAEED